MKTINSLCVLWLVSTFSAAAQTQIFSENFEGAFPNTWNIDPEPGVGGYSWGDNSFFAAHGSWSGFCADNGNDSAYTYPDDLHTYMQKEGIDLRGYSSAALTFSYLADTEAGFDFLSVYVWDQQGNPSKLWETSGNSGGWQVMSIDLSGFIGQTGLIIQFRFDSDGSNTANGVWLDDIVCLGPGTISLLPQSLTWATGFRYAINWATSNIVGNVNIWLSTDGGFNASVILSEVTNTGTVIWTVPMTQTLSNNCMLFVRSSLDPEVFGQSNLFAIVDGTLPSTVPVSATVSFPPEPTSSTAYKLFSFPGITSSITVSNILSGNQATDWRMYRDNGANGSPSVYLEELSTQSLLKTGEGYWLLKKGPLNVSRNMTMPRLDSDATYSIDLHQGWNIIGNPFDKEVAWSEVQVANGLSSGELYEYSAGSWPTTSTLELFKGYYFFTGVNAGSLKIPYPFGTPSAPAIVPPAVDWKVQLTFESDINRDSENYIGVAPSAKEALDVLDSRKPPLFLDQGFLYFSRPIWDREYSRFSSDFRPSLGDGQVWEFEVSNPRMSEGKISLRGIEQIPAEYDIKLINLQNSVPVDLRAKNEYVYLTTSEKMLFKLVVGKKAFVQNEISMLIPDHFDLAQNFPNPFNPVTSVIFMVPREAHVQLEVFSMLGQRVKTLADGRFAPAVHTIVWNGTDQSGRGVASGVYFYRLVAEGRVIQTRKMIFMK